MTVAAEIARFVFETEFPEFPVEVVDKAKQCLLDSIGVAIYGTVFPASEISLRVLEEIGGRGQAVVLGTACRLPAYLSAMANGIRAHVADYDDSLVDFKGHPSCVLMAASLAAAEMKDVNGRKLLEGFVLGNEVGSKLGQVMGWQHYHLGWHGTGTVGVLAAAIAAAKIIGLEPQQIINALGIAASSAAGLRQNFGSMTKSWHVGHAASAGLMAALLAQKGYDASSQAIEGESGFVQAFGGSGKASSLPEKLGQPYSLLNTMFKRYPSCGGTHPGVDAVLQLKATHGIIPEQVKTIVCASRPMLSSVLIHQRPRTGLEAKFSLEYCLAAALVKDRLTIAEFQDDAVREPQVRSLMERVEFKGDLGLDQLAVENNLLAPSTVKICLKSGREAEQTVAEARGGPSAPLKWQELEDKFAECATTVLSPARAAKVKEVITNLENLEQIADLTAHLTVP